jgi:hypothetical protein
MAERPDDEPLPRPGRPAIVELAAAILIVGGALGLLGGFTAAPGLPSGTESVFVLAIALDVGAIVVGVLVRLGRWWIVAVNYVAVLGFLDLVASGGSVLALLRGVADVVVVVILVLTKPWFDALAAWRAGQPFTPPTARPPTR